jgi:hypothetical protein
VGLIYIAKLVGFILQLVIHGNILAALPMHTLRFHPYPKRAGIIDKYNFLYKKFTTISKNYVRIWQ